MSGVYGNKGPQIVGFPDARTPIRYPNFGDPPICFFWGTLLGGSYNEDYTILGYIMGCPICGNAI